MSYYHYFKLSFISLFFGILGAYLRIYRFVLVTEDNGRNIYGSAGFEALKKQQSKAVETGIILSIVDPPKKNFNGFLTKVLEKKLATLVQHQALEPVCCKKRQKSPNQETGLGNRGPLEILNDTKLILND